MLWRLSFCVLNPLFPQRYSVDPTSRAEEVNIPLSTVEPAEAPADTFFQNGQRSISITGRVVLLLHTYKAESLFPFQVCKLLKVQSQSQRQNLKNRRSKKVKANIAVAQIDTGQDVSAVAAQDVNLHV